MIRSSCAVVALASSLVPAAVAAQAQPSPTASAAATAVPAAAPSADPAVTARARDWLHRVQTNAIDRSQLSADMNAALTDALEAQVAARFGALGDPSAFVLVDTKNVADSTAYIYRATFKSMPLYWLFAIDKAGKISGMRFLPAQ